MAELRPFKTYTGVQKRSASARKVGVAHALRDCVRPLQLEVMFLGLKIGKHRVGR